MNKTTTTNGQDLITDVKVREQLVNRLEVLDKVGGLMMLPNTEYATTRQVAGFFNVDYAMF